MKTILVRYGEIALKSSKVRKRFEKQLENNLKFVLNKEKISFKIKRLPLQGRIFIDTELIDKTIEILSNVFGIVSISPVIRVNSDINVILKKSLEFAKANIKENESFAIRVRRSGNHNFTSQDIANQVGNLINKEMKDKNIKVNLTKPDLIIYIEIRDEWAYIFKDIINGIGGFPYNTQDKLVSIFFGDFASFFSSWLILRKGCKIIPIFFNFSAILNHEILNQVKKAAKYLKKYINSKKFHIYIIPDSKKLIDSQKSLVYFNRLQLNLLLLNLIAEKLAYKKNAQGIVSYYTFSDIKNISKLKVLEEIIQVPIYKPCLGYNKDKLAEFKTKFDDSIFINRNELNLDLEKNGNLEIQSLNQYQIEDLQKIAINLTQSCKIVKI
ncbi:MAG: THUMP domain-containing protein [Candidatus Helarchaeota archaeon]